MCSYVHTLVRKLKKGTESGKGGGARGRTQSKEHGQDKEADGKKIEKKIFAFVLTTTFISNFLPPYLQRYGTSANKAVVKSSDSTLFNQVTMSSSSSDAVMDGKSTAEGKFWSWAVSPLLTFDFWKTSSLSCVLEAKVPNYQCCPSHCSMCMLMYHRLSHMNYSKSLFIYTLQCNDQKSNTNCPMHHVYLIQYITSLYSG